MRLALALAALLGLAACGSEEVGSPPEATRAAAYVHDGPATLTLLTVINNTTGNGAHTGLLVNGAQRVMWDPAGTFNTARVLPESGDVLYGLTPGWYEAYVDYHTRPAYRTIEQTVEVSPAVAAQVLALVEANGAASKATCALSTSGILRQVAGFEGIGSTWFPAQLMESFETVPGVVTRTYEDPTDAEDPMIVNDGLLMPAGA